MYRFYTRRNINIGLVIFLALIFFFGWYTFLNMRKARQETRTVNTTVKSLHALEDILDDMQDMETGNRGYLISGNKEFLAPYYLALSKLQKDTITLNKLFPIYPERASVFSNLLLLVNQKATIAAEYIARMSEDTRDSLYAEVKSGKSKLVMDSIRQIISSFEKDDRLMLESSNEQHKVAAITTSRLFVVSAIIFLITLFFLFWAVKKELRYREENEKQLSHLASLVEKVSDAIFSTDLNAIILSWNKGAEDIYGYTKEEAIGKFAPDITRSVNTKEAVAEILAKVPEHGSLDIEILNHDKKGQTIYCLASVTALKNEQGEITGYVTILRNITERKRAEELLGKFNDELTRQVKEKTAETNDSNERFEIISRTTHDAIWEWNLETGKMWANETHQHLYGVTLADPVPDEKEWEERIHPNEREAVVTGLHDMLASDKNVWMSEYRFRTGNDYKYIYGRSYIVRNETGKPVRILGSMMDVTERKKAELSIKESESRFRSFFENSMDGILLTAPDGRVFTANAAACLMFGMTVEEICLAGRFGIVDPDNPNLSSFLAQRKETGKAKGELILLRKDGSKFSAGVTSSVFLDINGEERTSIIIRDITENKKFEELILKEKELSDKVINSLPGIFYMFDVNRKLLRWNENFQTVLGFSTEEISHITPLNFFAEEDRTIAKQKVEETFQRGSANLEANLFTKAGEKIPYFFTGLSVKYGNTLCMLGSGIEIKERKIAEAALKASEEKLRHVLTSSADDFYVIDKNYIVILINEKAEKNLLKIWKRSVKIGDNILESAPADKKQELKESYDNALSGKRIEKEVSNTINDKQHWTQVQYVPVSNEAGAINGVYVVTKDITVRRVAEEELRQSNNRFEMITRTTNDAVWDWDLETGKVWGNETHQHLYGLTMSDAVPNEEIWTLRVHPDDRERMVKIQAEALASKKNIFISEYRFLTEEKGYRNIYDRCYIMRNLDGKPIRMMGSMMDITERKKAEEELKKSNERFELIGQATNDAIWEWNLETNEVWGNEMHQQLYGLTLADPTPDDNEWKRRLHSDDKERMIKIVADALASGESSFDAEYRFYTENKGWMNVYGSTYIERNKEGKAVRLLGSMMDITARKIAEEAIKLSEAQYKALVENAPEALVVFDVQQQKFVNVSESAVRLFKMSKEELLKIGPLQVSPEYQPDGKLSAEAALKKINEAIAGGKPSFEWMHHDKYGTEIPCEVWLVRLPSENKVLVRGSIIDITERKKAAEAIIKTNARFQMVSKATSDIVWDWDLQNESLWWNDNYYSTLGYCKQKEIVPINEWYSKIHQDDIEQVKAKLKRNFEESGSSWQDAYRYIKADGTYLNFLDRGFIMRDSEGKAYRMIGSKVDMTPIYEAQRKVAESENRLRTIINSEPQCIKLIDRNGLLLDMNPAGLSMIEADSVEQIIGQPITKIIDLEYRKAFNDLVKQVFKGNSGKLLFSITGLKGTKRWLETHAVPMKDAGEKINALLGVTIDVTDKRKAEEELMRNEEKYRTLVEQAVDAIALYDEAGRILDVNTGSVNLLGYTKEELIHMSLQDILTKKEISTKPVRYDVLQAGESTMKQRKMRRKDGSTVETEVRSQQLPDGRFLSVIRDLTDREKAKQQIEREKELSDKLIDSLPGVFYSYDEEGKFLRWNKQFEIVTGYSGKEIEGMHPTDFFDGEDRLHIIERIADVFLEGISDAEADFISKDGSRRLYYFKAIRIVIDGKPCLLGTGIDISDRKKAEQELEASYKAIRKLTEHLQNIREEERKHIAREIHDELGQHLTVLKMDVSWLNKKISSPDEKIKQKMKGLLEMLDETVKTVRRISSELRPSLLDDLGLAAAMEWQLNEFEKRSGIKTKLDAPEPEIKLPDAIKTALFRIFQESLTNVARHSGAKKLTVNLGQQNNNFVLSIIDDGKGFDRQKIKEKRTLGILGMQERTSMIGGTYNITSKPGKGTIVEVVVSLEELKNLVN